MLKIKWPKVMNYDDLKMSPLVSWIDLCNGTMFRIFAFFSHGEINTPKEGLFIGIERISCFFFNLENEIHWEYVSNKLFIPEADARCLADWMNVQLGHNAKQQGTYEKKYLEETEPYGLIGERFLMPLVPEIINDNN